MVAADGCPQDGYSTADRVIRSVGCCGHRNWFVEGDIQACFDDIEPKILVNLLRKKIKDERFLNLIWKLLRAGYLDLQGKRKDSLAGTPQGNIATPPTMLQTGPIGA